MNNNKPTKHRLHLYALFASLGLSATAQAAGTDTWVSSPTTADWSTAGNWTAGTGGSTPPVAGDSLAFGSTTGTTLVNDLTAGTSFAALTFNSGASAYTLTGNALTLTGNVTNNSSAVQTINLNTTLSASSGFNTFVGNNADGGFVVGGTISSASRLVIKNTSLTLATSTAVSSTTLPAFPRISLGDSGGTTSSLYLLNGVTLNVKAVDANNTAITGTGPMTLTVGMNTAGTSTFSGTGSANVAVDLRVLAASTGATTWNFLAATGATVNFTGAIVSTNSTTQALHKTGAGTVVFSGTNTYQGATFVDAGTLQLGNGGTTGSLATTGTIVNNGNLTINRSNAVVQGTDFSSAAISGTGSLTQAGTGNLTLSGANTFSGGLAITAGKVTSGAASALGSGQITLGDTTGSAAATLDLGNFGTTSYANNVVLGGTTGALTIQQAGGANNTLSGSVTGTGNLSVGNTTVGAGANLTFSGLVNNAGTITNSATGAGAVLFTGGIGSSVTQINHNSATASTTIAALAVNSGGTTLQNNAGTKVLTVTGGVTGTGNLILQNNSATSGGIVLSGTTINPTGTITNSGTGTGSTTISAVIGTNVLGVVQNSATSSLTLSGNNTYTGATTISAGTLAIGASERIANTSNLILGGGTFALGGFTETLGTLQLTANSGLDLGSGGKAIFADSSLVSWTGGTTLSVTGTFVSGSSIRFGSTSGGLSGSQWGQISIAGFTLTGLDASGFLVGTASAVPEPATYAALAGLGILGFAAYRRRRA